MDNDVIEWVKRMMEQDHPKTDKLPRQPPILDSRGVPPPEKPAMAYPKTRPMWGPPWPASVPIVHPWVLLGGKMVLFLAFAAAVTYNPPPPAPPGYPDATFLGYDGRPDGARAPMEVWRLPDGTIIRRDPVSGDMRWPGGLQPKRK